MADREVTNQFLVIVKGYGDPDKVKHDQGQNLLRLVHDTFGNRGAVYTMRPSAFSDLTPVVADHP